MVRIILFLGLIALAASRKFADAAMADLVKPGQ